MGGWSGGWGVLDVLRKIKNKLSREDVDSNLPPRNRIVGGVQSSADVLLPFYHHVKDTSDLLCPGE